MKRIMASSSAQMRTRKCDQRLQRSVCLVLRHSRRREILQFFQASEISCLSALKSAARGSDMPA